MPIRACIFAVLVLVAACGSQRHGATAARAADGSKFSACPAQGRGAIVAPAACYTTTPERLGAAGSGANANARHYALEPAGAPRAELVVFLNASLATPAAQIADPTTNLYSTLAAGGFHVVALAYRSTAIVGLLCRDQPDCYGPTRETLIRGVFSPGAARALSDIRQDEGIVYRLEALLSALARERSAAGWGRFLKPGATVDARIDWAHVTVTGHSQGGGHAAYLGRLFALRRVVQLSSTCDATSGVPAPWTRASEPWATSPHAAFYGLSVSTRFDAGEPTGGDRICAHHRAVWSNMGMDAAHAHDDAQTCAHTAPHTAPIACTVNAPRWWPLFD